jgi:hypothetical protein
MSWPVAIVTVAIFVVVCLGACAWCDPIERERRARIYDEYRKWHR